MHSTLSRGESVGLAFVSLIGLGSSIAALFVLIVLSRRMSSGWHAMDIYVIDLFAAEVIQGLGHALSTKWVIEGEVNVGTFCTAQGALQQLGEVGVALATLAIAVQTFVAIWWLKSPVTSITSVFVGVQWVFIVLFVAIGFGVHTHPPTTYYATPVPYWCWLGQGFKAERLAGEYIWFWLALFISIILYLPLYLFHLGFIEPGDRWYQPTVDKGNNRGRTDRLWTVILYPSVYCLVILPLSVVRWIGFKQEDTLGESHIPPVATFVVIIIFTLSGLLNAVMYPLTRSSLFWPEERPEPVLELAPRENGVP
jgi:hypothetical protein